MFPLLENLLHEDQDPSFLSVFPVCTTVWAQGRGMCDENVDWRLCEAQGFIAVS